MVMTPSQVAVDEHSSPMVKGRVSSRDYSCCWNDLENREILLSYGTHLEQDFSGLDFLGHLVYFEPLIIDF